LGKNIENKEIKEFIEYFGEDNLPSINQEPRRFNFYLKLWANRKQDKPNLPAKSKTGDIKK
jgi:predicted transport protein